jgi:hypothetical protein
MSEGHSTYTPTTGLGRWFDARMPLPRLVYDSFVAYPVPRNLNYMWTFGAILSIMLVCRSSPVSCWRCIMSPIRASPSVRSRRSCATSTAAGCCATCTANGASFFFIAVYLHIFRGLYYGSYKAPREILWILGVHHLSADDGDRLHGLRAAVGPDVLLGRYRHHRLLHRHSRWSASGSSSFCSAALRSTIRR